MNPDLLEQSVAPHRSLSRWLLRLYPEAFRVRHGDEWLAAYDRYRADARYASPVVGRLRFMRDLSLDLARSSTDLWLQELTAPALATARCTPNGGSTMASLSAFPTPTAHQRFKQSFGSTLWASMVGATALHFLVLNFFPNLTAASLVTDATSMEVVAAIDIPLPEPPADLVRPAAPVIAADAVAVTLTLPDASALWEAAPQLPPPPTQAADPGAAYSLLTPSMVAPSIKNRGEVARALEREYPSLLRDAGIGGTVHVLFYVNAQGGVDDAQVQTSSGHSALDTAALRVAQVIQFSPAINRDQAVGVVVAFPIRFEVR